MLGQLMLFAEDFPAKTSPLRDWERVWTEPGPVSGKSTPALLANLDPLTSSWRTSQHSLEGGLTSFSETWPRSGMMRSGIAFQLPPLVLLTDETGSGSWPTPNTVGWRSDGELGILAKTLETRAEFVAMTDRAAQSKRERHWPTPTRSMHKGSSAGAMTRLSGASRLNDRLDYAVEQGQIKTGRLNPLWVAWLMGFPIEWASFAPTVTR